MLSAKSLVNSGVTTAYFAKDDYYAKESLDQESQWYGKGAEKLGLAGAVDRDAFRAVLEGRLPTGDELGVHRYIDVRGLDLKELVKSSGVEVKTLNDVLNLRTEGGKTVYQELGDEKLKEQATSMRFSPVTGIDSERVGVWYHRPGWDFTFNAPKSVSIVAEVGGDKRVFEAHDRAVQVALSKMEQAGVGVRSTSDDGISLSKSGNMVAGLFRHDTSREMDPHLHTHSVIMNITQNSEGKWKTLESKGLFDRKMFAGMVYRGELAKSLRGLGYDVEKTHDDGRFEIKNVPEKVLEEFSKRREQIEKVLENSYKSDAKAAERAALSTRVAKVEHDRENLRETWKDASNSLGFDARQFVKLAQERQELKNEDLSNEAVVVEGGVPGKDVSQDYYVRDQVVLDASKDAVKFAAAKLGEREAVFKDDDLIKEAMQHAVGYVDLASVEHAIKDLSKGKELIHAVLGKEKAWTSREAIYLESASSKIMKSGKGKTEQVGKRIEVKRHLESYGLLKGQASAARLILQSKDRVVGVQGYAGTGKTFMLNSVREFAEAKGYEVKGFAPSATAANTLESEAGIESKTIARHLIEITKEIGKAEGKLIGGKAPDLSKQIWMVDEASMKSNRDMYDFLRASEKTGAKVVLVGDVKQLPSVDAGKPFDVLRRAGMNTALMDEIKRQDNETLKAAVYDSISGQARAALNKISDTVIQEVNRDKRIQMIADQYLGMSPADREKSFVLSPANEDRIALNNHIREGLKKEGSLGKEDIQTTAYDKAGLSRVEMARASYYKSGDYVRFGKKYRSLGVEKGEYASVQDIDKDKGIVRIQLQSGLTVNWQPHKVAGNRKKGGVEVYKPKNRNLAKGDKIRWTRNDEDRGIRNTQNAKVEKIEGKFATLILRDGSRLKIDISLPENKHWDHAYASTIYASQGGTVKTVIVNGESWRKNLVNQKSFYVALSRAKDKAYVYVDDKEKFISAVEKRSGDKTSGLESVDRSRYQKKESVSSNARDINAGKNESLQAEASRNELDKQNENAKGRDMNEEQNRHIDGQHGKGIDAGEKSPEKDVGPDGGEINSIQGSKGFTDKGLVVDALEQEMKEQKQLDQDSKHAIRAKENLDRGLDR